MAYIGLSPLGSPVANTVVEGSIASSAVTTSAIAANAITTELIANGAVGADDLASSAVTTAKLASSAVNSSKLDSNLTLAGTATYLGSAIEKTSVNSLNVTPTITFSPFEQAAVYYAANSNTNTSVTVNFTGLSNLTTGNVLSATVLLTNNATYNAYISAVQVDGIAATTIGTGGTVLVNGSISGNVVRWQGSAPTVGFANVEVYSFSIFKNNSSSYLVLGSRSNFS